jgi:pyruvate/2-oxoglutarate dehydrogenase complex dihydrolipoamide acyltransferase (E2) component
MPKFHFLPRNRFFEVVGGIMFENYGDNKVAFLREVDMSRCIALREKIQQESGEKPSYTTLIASAVAQTLKSHPYANRIAVEYPFFKRIVQLDEINITIAVERDTPGLEQATYAGTITNIDQLSILEINRELRRIANTEGEHGERWALFQRIVTRFPAPLARFILRFPRLWPGLWIQHRGGAVMISSPAKYGVDAVVGNWPWPLGFSFGIVRDRAVAENKQIMIRPTTMLSMSFDRRLFAGAPAARFFNAVSERIIAADLEPSNVDFLYNRHSETEKMTEKKS